MTLERRRVLDEVNEREVSLVRRGGEVAWSWDEEAEKSEELHLHRVKEGPIKG